MAQGIIIYHSKYGATQQYVDWLQQKTGFDVRFKRPTSPSELENYDIVIVAGGTYALGIEGATWLRRNLKKLNDKAVAVFAVGASEPTEELLEELRRVNLKDELSDIPCFFGRGRWDEDKLTNRDRNLAALIYKISANEAPENRDPWPKALVEAYGSVHDWTDPKYLDPLLDWIESVD